MQSKTSIEKILATPITKEDLTAISNKILKNKQYRSVFFKNFIRNQDEFINYFRNFKNVNDQLELLKIIYKSIPKKHNDKIIGFNIDFKFLNQINALNFEELGYTFLCKINKTVNDVFGFEVKNFSINNEIVENQNKKSFCFFNCDDIKIISKNLYYIKYSSISNVKIDEKTIVLSLIDKKLKLSFKEINELTILKIKAKFAKNNINVEKEKFFSDLKAQDSPIDSSKNKLPIENDNIEISKAKFKMQNKKNKIENDKITDLKNKRNILKPKINIKNKQNIIKNIESEKFLDLNNKQNIQKPKVNNKKNETKQISSEYKDNYKEQKLLKNNFVNNHNLKTPKSTEKKEKLYHSLILDSCLKLKWEAKELKNYEQSTESEHLIHDAFNFNNNKANNLKQPISSNNDELNINLTKSYLKSIALNSKSKFKKDHLYESNTINNSLISSNIFKMENSSSFEFNCNNNHSIYNLIEKKKNKLKQLKNVKKLKSSKINLNLSFSFSLFEKSNSKIKKKKIKKEIDYKEFKKSNFLIKDERFLNQDHKKSGLINQVDILIDYKSKLFDEIKNLYICKEKEKLNLILQDVKNYPKKLRSIIIKNQ